MENIPPVTLLILIATCITSIAAFSNHALLNKLMFDPYLIRHKGQWYRFITGAFIHANWVHLIFNMWALYVFGAVVERQVYPELFGGKGLPFFILLYLGGIILSSVYSYEKHKNNPYYKALGASGAVSAVIMPFALVAPTSTLLFFFIPMPAGLFAVLYLIMSWYLAKREDQTIGHDAHFWGAVFGIAFTLIMNQVTDGPSIIKDYFLPALGIYL